MGDPTHRRTWRTVLLIGCGGLVVFAAGIMLVVALNWTKIQSLYRSATSTLSELRIVQSAVQAKYSTAQVAVTIKRQSGVAGSILSIKLINPSFYEIAPDDLRSKALEVALAARAALPPQSKYDHYEVEFARQSGAGITVSTNQTFLFPATELEQQLVPATD